MVKFVVFCMMLATASALGAGNSDNVFRLGSGLNGDKVFEFNSGLGTGNRKIRLGGSSGKLEFSNDGTNFRYFNLGTDIDSGSAALGTVLTADGSGRSAFQIPPTAPSRTGEVISTILNCPTGSVSAADKLIGKTTGDYQGAIYYNLYASMWTLPGLSTTAGHPFKISAEKGASALADWDAGKTISIDFSTNEIFIRQDGANTALGGFQSDQFQGHYHSLSYSTFANATGSPYDRIVRGTSGVSTATTIGSPTDDGINGDPRTGLETRPKNVALNMCIFY